MELIERGTAVFDSLTEEFSTSLGKVGPFTSIMNVAFNIMKSFNATIWVDMTELIINTVWPKLFVFI